MGARRARHFLEGIATIIFPNICVCCGIETTERQRRLCAFCLEERFEYAPPGRSMSSAGTILPDSVFCQVALWKFDKGGTLQKLLHELKYNRLTHIGSTLGRKLGHYVLQHEEIAEFLAFHEAILLPVPLHYLKFRKRGFNQAFFIAAGLQKVLDIPICEAGDVVRRKNTRTQTGFSLERRISNMEGAFHVNNPECFKGKAVLIVDDVFTTGSTAFELHRTLRDAGAGAGMILTVAQA